MVRSKRWQLLSGLRVLDKGAGALVTYVGELMESFEGNLEGIAAFKIEDVAPRLSFLASVNLTFWDTTKVTKASRQNFFFVRGIRALSVTKKRAGLWRTDVGGQREIAMKKISRLAQNQGYSTLQREEKTWCHSSCCLVLSFRMVE